MDLGPGWATPKAVQTDLRRVLGGATAVLRSSGRRVVLDAPQEGLGFGNFLYLWLHAHQARLAGVAESVRVPAPLERWFAAYPALLALSVSTREIRPTDRRVFSWNSRYGTDFSREELDGFVARCLLGGEAEASAVKPSEVALNIRRGDYYSKPHFRGAYGFDIPMYVELALEQVRQSGAIGRVTVVSDDLDWCELKLGALLSRTAESVAYLRASPEEQFDRLGRTPRIIGTNSTFSYWGAYVSTYRHGGAGHIVMPRFHARHGAEPWAYQLDPSWDIVNDLPGGWDA